MRLTANEVLLMHPVKRARVLDWIREQGLEPDEVRSFREAYLRLQAECEHANVEAADMTSVGDSGRRYVAYCQDCGLKLNGVTGAW